MTFYFYDLETSGFDARYGRIMQFAGQRTDENLKLIGKPLVELVKLTEEVLPSPEAVLVTGITPQRTIEDGFDEAQFLKKFASHALKPDTVFLGYNNIRFDDEFMRFLLYRNFYDAYEWQWQEGRGRWDLLDVGRMMRALRPEGIQWPEDSEGKPTNRLEALTKANQIEHGDAHDALGDVKATIELARLFKSKQPKLFDYLLGMRSKASVAEIVDLKDPKPFVYSSGRYPSENQKTTIAIPISAHPHNANAVLVYDLRVDPETIKDMEVDDMLKILKTRYQDRAEDFQPLPIKQLMINRSPAIAPLGVLDDASWKRINLNLATVQKNLKLLKSNDIIAKRALATWEEYSKPRDKKEDIDGQLYDGFIPDKDKEIMLEIRKKTADDLADWHPKFMDERLDEMFLRYKARNYPSSLSQKEQKIWKETVSKRLNLGIGHSPSLENYFKSLQKLSQQHGSDEKKQFLLEELRLYGQSLVEDLDSL